ncbi:MAG: site-2 protease family protein [Bdellovibrionota bacterium]
MEEFILRVCYSAPGFLMAICLHEYGHAWMSNRFGDNTAKSHGRLSLNPAVHYDLFGTIILPIIFAASGLGIFGYAKPVPVDARNFKSFRKAIFWVSFAGPLANVMLMVLSAFFFVLMSTFLPKDFFLFEPLVNMLYFSVNINVLLAVFNLIPIPPLDGSRMVSSFLSYDKARFYEGLERYSFMFFLLLWMTHAFDYLMYPARIASSGIVFIFSLMFS